MTDDISRRLRQALADHRQEHRADTGDSVCACGEWRGPFTQYTGPRSYAGHLAEVTESVVVDRLKFAALEIERELICCYGETCDDMQHEICRWGMAGRLIVLEVASGERFGDV